MSDGKLLEGKVLAMIAKTKELINQRITSPKTKPVIQYTSTLEDQITKYLTYIWLAFFCVMDIILFDRIKNWPIRTLNPKPYAEMKFDFFAMLSIKGIMEDHLTLYFIWPTTELFEQLTGISRGYPVVTPNAISCFGLFVGLLAARMVCSENMTWKRLGVLTFVFRLWLDGLDGVVFRMQNFSGADRHTQLSVRYSSGWMTDAFCDFSCGILLLFAMYRTIKQDILKIQPIQVLPWTSCPSKRKFISSAGTGQLHFSMFTVKMKILSAAALQASSAPLWDYFISQYRGVFEVTLSTADQQELQNQLFKSLAMVTIIWGWKIMNAVSLGNMACLAIVHGKSWDYLVYLQVYGTSALVLLVIGTYFHLHHVKHALSMAL